ncbi:MAG TPA: hypothetical protein VIQ00_12365 [Chitinophagaceae bacterium]
MLKVYKECCKNCLISKDRIVSPERAKEILNECAENQTHFICHKASIEDKEIVCATFYKTLGYKSQMVRIAQRLNMIEFIDQPDCEKLPTYAEMNSKDK